MDYDDMGYLEKGNCTCRIISRSEQPHGDLYAKQPDPGTWPDNNLS